jgi:hypothetical protein
MSSGRDNSTKKEQRHNTNNGSKQSVVTNPGTERVRTERALETATQLHSATLTINRDDPVKR